MTKLTLSRLTPLLLLSVSIACVTAVKNPSHTSNYDAAVVTDASEVGEDASIQQDAGNDSSTDAVASSVEEDASVEVKVDTTPIFIDYIHTAMKEWVHIPCSNDGKDCQCFWNPDPKKIESCIQDYDKFYREVATTIVEVVSEPDIILPITGENFKVKSALLVTSIAAKEGGFHKKVDNCTIVGDNGIAFGLWQTHTSRYTSCRDRKMALREAIKIVMQSFNACKNLPLQYRLTAYASGNCVNEYGRANSRAKVNRAIDYLAAHPYTDQ